MRDRSRLESSGHSGRSPGDLEQDRPLAPARRMCRMLRQGGTATGPMARLLAKEAIEAAGALGRVRRVAKLSEMAYASAAVATLIGGIITDTADQEQSAGHLDTVLANADNPEDVLNALDQARADLSPEEFRLLLEAFGTAYEEPIESLAFAAFGSIKNRGPPSASLSEPPPPHSMDLEQTAAISGAAAATTITRLLKSTPEAVRDAAEVIKPGTPESACPKLSHARQSRRPQLPTNPSRPNRREGEADPGSVGQDPAPCSSGWGRGSSRSISGSEGARRNRTAVLVSPWSGIQHPYRVGVCLHSHPH